MKNKAITLGISFVLSWPVCYADAVTDGSLGKVVHLHGNMTIDQTLGKVNGHNLFHSFKVFDVNKGQTATFTGSSAIQNVISRVTGKQPSNIDGLIKSEVGKANFYFINPNGVVFGEDAKVDVPGAFHVSTANALNFSGDKVFSATHPGNASSLTASEPESFGFLGNSQGKNGTIRFNDATITDFGGVDSKSQKVYFIARNITIDNGSQIKNSGGEIYLDAVGNIKYDENIKHNKIYNLKDSQHKGELYINNKSAVDTNGDGGGLINIQAGNLSIGNESILSAQNRGSINAINKGIYIKAYDTVNLISGGQIKASAYSTGIGGNIEIYSKNLHIVGYKKNDIKLDTQKSGIINEVGCANSCKGWGSGGNINIKSGTIMIVDSGEISSSSYGKIKSAGKINIESNNIVIDGKNQKADAVTGISSNSCINESSFCQNSSASAGRITINANTVSIQNNAAVSSTVSSLSGNSGEIVINEKPEYSSRGIVRLINSRVVTSAKNNNGGNITISGKALVLNGGIIQANANMGNNKGGKIKINTTTLLVSHGQLQLGGLQRNNFPSGFNVIQAVSEQGETGTVNSTKPELNINGAMLKLKSNLLPAPDLNTTPCKTSQGSSLIQAGYGGLPQKFSEGVYIPGQLSSKRSAVVLQNTTIKNNKKSSGCAAD